MSAIVNTHRGRIATAGVAAAILAALAGCSTVPFDLSAGKPALSDAPRVPSPRDLRGIPVCNLLTPAQAASFGLDPASANSITDKISDGESTEICRFRARDIRSRASLTAAYRLDPGGLDRLYLSREFMRVFEPGTLDEFPYVRTENEDNISCEINVGVADDQVLVASSSRLPGAAGPSACDTARALASAVLANLPPLR